MRHPEVLVLAVLPLADYYLTLWGAALAARGYGRHFKSQSYELNPLWRSDVARGRLFNPRHLLLALALVVVLGLAGELGDDLADWFFPTLFGMVLGAFAPIIAQHVGNIVMFGFLNRHPGEVVGEVTISMRYVILISLTQSLTVLAPLALAAIVSREPLVAGMLVGAGVLTLARLSWLRRASSSTDASKG